MIRKRSCTVRRGLLEKVFANWRITHRVATLLRADDEIQKISAFIKVLLKFISTVQSSPLAGYACR